MAKTMKNTEFLRKLLTCASPAGYELEARKLLNSYLSGRVDRFYTDVVGNSIAVINEKAPYKVMITGHQDEIGMQVTHINDEGFLYFRNNGGPNYSLWSGCELEIITQDGRHVPAILMNKKSPSGLCDKDFEPDAMWLDIGAKGKKAAEKLVSIGDYVVSRPNFKFLDGTRFISKALDDKIGVYVAAEAFLKIAAAKPKIGVYFVGAVQEEVGSRGGKVAAQAIKPNVGFAIDVTHASDVPEGNVKHGGLVKLGEGAGIFRNANNTEALLQRMLKVAKAKKIKHQLLPHYQSVSWTDASVLQVVEGGVATALVGIPNRYMHSQVEMCDMVDVESAINIIAETVLTFKPTDKWLPEI